MRFYTDYALTKTVRNAEKFVTPKNVILKVLIFLLVFYIGQIAESIPLVLAVMPKLTAWATEQIKTTGSLDETALQEKLTNLLADPANTKIMLYCTIFAPLITLLFCRFIEGRKLTTFFLLIDSHNSKIT